MTMTDRPRCQEHPTGVTWHELRPLHASLFRCDAPRCRSQADTIHLLPWCGAECEHALFARPRHDPGGYWLYIRDWLRNRRNWQRHLAGKIDPARCDLDHPGGLYVLLGRERELTCVAVKPGEPSAA
jgi:hypothetical protein